jgi:hypothetical protein
MRMQSSSTNAHIHSPPRFALCVLSPTRRDWIDKQLILIMRFTRFKPRKNESFTVEKKQYLATSACACADHMFYPSNNVPNVESRKHCFKYNREASECRRAEDCSWDPQTARIKPTDRSLPLPYRKIRYWPSGLLSTVRIAHWWRGPRHQAPHTRRS